MSMKYEAEFELNGSLNLNLTFSCWRIFIDSRICMACILVVVLVPQALKAASGELSTSPYLETKVKHRQVAGHASFPVLMEMLRMR